jgi:bacillithiol biosynthesis deacetylase BshB1
VEPIDILAVFSHPDDAELTVGGTLLKMKSLGYRTGVLDATMGEMGTRGTVEMRHREAEAAAAILKLDIRENLELPDGHVADDDRSRQILVKALRRLKPSLVLTHQLDDPHPDHDAVARLTRSACRLASMRNYDPETGDEKIAVPAVAHNTFSRRVIPSFIVDIGDVLEEKMNAIRAHASQFFDPASKAPETRLTDKNFLRELEDRSRYFGSLIGTAAGEPFFVREALNIEDPVALLSRSMNIYS